MRSSLIILLVSIVLFVAGSGCIGGILQHPDVVYPHIGPLIPGASPILVDYQWRFEKGEESIDLPVNGSVYLAAKRADKNATLYKDLPETEWMQGYYRAFINDPAQEGLYQALAQEFRKIRDREGLDDNRYLELMTVFVQSIPYRTDTDRTLPKFPVETYGDREGDCDDKSLLLAGLLVREGYNVSLLYFGPENHVAVGVLGNDAGYRSTGYIYLETTNLSFIGVPPETLAGGVTLDSMPLVIPVGSGHRIYSATGEVKYIQERYNGSENSLRLLDSELERMRQELEMARHAGRIREYNALVEKYNRRLGEFRSTAAIHDYILLHRFDRIGTYQWLQAHP